MRGFYATRCVLKVMMIHSFNTCYFTLTFLHLYIQTKNKKGILESNANEAKCFVKGLHGIGMKWTNMDPTTISSGYQHDKEKEYNEMRARRQSACRSASKSTSITNDLSYQC